MSTVTISTDEYDRLKRELAEERSLKINANRCFHEAQAETETWIKKYMDAKEELVALKEEEAVLNTKIDQLCQSIDHCDRQEMTALKRCWEVENLLDWAMEQLNYVDIDPDDYEKAMALLDSSTNPDRFPRHPDRTHEECAECIWEKVNPPKCHGHAAGETPCNEFEPRGQETKPLPQLADYGKIECPNCLGRIPEPKEWFDESGNWRPSDKIVICPGCSWGWRLSCSEGYYGNMPIMEEVYQEPKEPQEIK